MLFARCVQQASLLVGLLALTWLGSSESAGQYVLSLAFCAPYIMLTNMQLHVALSGDRSEKYHVYEYVIHRLIALLIAFVAIGLTTTLVTNDLVLWQTILAMSVAKIVESLSDLLCGLQQREERMSVVSCSLLLRGITALIALAGGFWFSNSIAFANLMVAAAWGIVLLAYDIPVALKLLHEREILLFPVSWIGIQWNRIRSLAWVVLPLGMTSGIASLELNAPRFIVHGLFGEGVLGIFSTLMALTMSGQLIMASVAQSAIPRIAVLHNEGESTKLSRLVWQLYAVGIGAGLLMFAGLMTLGEWLLTTSFGSEFAGEFHLLPFLAIAATLQFGAAMLSTSLRSIQRYKQSMFAHLVNLIITVIACTALAQSFGTAGVGYGMILSALVSNIVLAVLLRDILLNQRRKYPEEPRHKESTSRLKQQAA